MVIGSLLIIKSNLKMNSTPLRRTSRQLKPTFLNQKDWIVDKSIGFKNNSTIESDDNELTKRSKSKSLSNKTKSIGESIESLNQTLDESINKSIQSNQIESVHKSKRKSIVKSSIKTLDTSVKESSIQSNKTKSANKSKNKSIESLNEILDKSLNESSIDQDKIIVIKKKRGRPKKASEFVESTNLIEIKTSKRKRLLSTQSNELSNNQQKLTKKIVKPIKKLIKKKLNKKYVIKLKEKKRRVCVQERVDDASEYRCSACNEIFVKKDVAYKHTLIVHNGLARLNDTNNQFSEREILAAFRAAIEMKKILNCLRCNKSFGTALGLKFHYEICGKSEEELIKKCEKCGNILKISSMKSHLDMHLRREEMARIALAKSINGDDKSMDDDDDDLLKRPIRKSAKKANEFLKSTAEFGDSDQDNRKKGKNSDDDNFDFNLSSDDDSSQTSGEMMSTHAIESLGSRINSKKSSQINLSWLKETENFQNQHFSESVFEDWISDEHLITFLNEKESENYLPERKCSAKFKFKTCTEDQIKTTNSSTINEQTKEIQSDQNIDVNNRQTSNNDWKTLNLFETLINKHHVTFYTGGPVYSGAWCPFPLKASANQDQILCLSTNVKNRVYNAFDCEQYAGCLQFWNFGKLKVNSCDFNKPVLEFIIAHNYGTISELVWCPGGTSFIPKTDNSNGRFGLLALACTDGHIRILSIPLIEQLNQQSSSNKLKVIKLQPLIILDRHPIGLSVFNKPTICKTLSWSQTEKQRYIAAGYGCGLISIFDLQTNSSLLKKTNSTGSIELKPKKSWIAHGACVNSVKWLPLVDCSYIVSGGFDRVIKIWSLEDMTTNIVLPKKAIITNVHWLSRYIGCYFSSDDCYTNLHNNVTFRDLTLSNFTNSFSRHKTCVWDFDISNWTNTEVGVDASGEAILSVYVKPKNGKKYSKARPYECLPVYRLTYESLTEGEQVSQIQNSLLLNNKSKIPSSINYLIDHEKPIQRTLDDMINSYGLVFNDVDLTLYSSIPKSEFERLKISDTMNYPRLGDYPLISLNKVQINPNKSASNYIFTGGESGLSRVSYVEFLKNPFFTIYIK